jgi:cellulose synthase/poly-beta-1,6-N-acetylglucosamine synthase-like glycosyltransferase
MMTNYFLELNDEAILVKDDRGQNLDIVQKEDYIKYRVGYFSKELPEIMIFTPVKDRAWILPDFLKHILHLDYPKSKLRLVFIPNDCSDDSEQILRTWREQHQTEYKKIDIITYNINVPKDKRNARIFSSYYSYLAVIRNHGLHQLKNEDYIFSIDSDILVKPETLKKLVSDRKDIVSSLVPNNLGKTVWNILNWTTEDTAKHILKIPESSLMQVGFTGACYLIHSRVINMGVRYGYHIQGEDGYFCKMALQKGFKIYCDTNLKQNHIMRKEDY